jgi:hypothetical protein
VSERYLDSDRKARQKGKKNIERYTYIIEGTYKRYIATSLADLFASWESEQTRIFNKGVDKALSGVQWKVYPKENVVLEEGDGDWGVWLREQCEGLGMAKARCGQSALEEM